jgi:phosphate transport system substrate-binding protein
MKSHPNVKIEVIGGGSGFGINEIGEKRIDIGMAGRNIKSSEKEKYPNLIASKIAVDGVAIVINKENPINNLTTEQLQKIYSKTITNWKEVGGTDEPITVYTRDELSGTRDTFWKLALNKNNISDRALIVASNGEMKAKVSADKNGIGYISVGYIDESVKPVALDGVNPTKENIKKGDYKVYRPLILITNGEPEPTVKEYINYILSPEGQKIVESKGFLSIN